MRQVIEASGAMPPPDDGDAAGDGVMISMNELLEDGRLPSLPYISGFMPPLTFDFIISLKILLKLLDYIPIYAI